ncbi:alpha-L-fucosidase [soil metagenome]
MNKLIAVFTLMSAICNAGIGQAKQLAKPSAVQYKWQEQDRIMFIHFGVATWLGMEYDETGKFDLSRMNPTELNTDDWCKTALSWGAREIIFVAKHVGGFCWWPTNTTEYCVRNIPWKNGKGDLFADLAASCKKYGINMGVYIYPGDVKYGAGIGSGGKTADPTLQESYNKVYRQQLTEVLTRYGSMTEVWFDGNCVVDVSDILEAHAKDAVIFQSTNASIRWPGTESGMLAYPAWNSLKSSALKTGLSTQYDDDPDGDAWAPLEADAPLYSHYWFWSPSNEKKRKSVDELMEMYYKSAGYGGMQLINCSPDTTGKVVEGDRKTYLEFGNEIKRSFSHPLKTVKNITGTSISFHFEKPANINHVIMEEDYREGHRIRAYKVEGKVKGAWVLLSKGTSVGRKKIDAFDNTLVSDVKLTITTAAATPLIRSVSVFNVGNYVHKVKETETSDWKVCGEWNTKDFKKGKDTISLDLSKLITTPGQYEVKFLADVAITGTAIDSAGIIFENQNTMQEYLTRKDHSTFYINRTSQISASSSSVLKLYIHSDNDVYQNRGVFKIRPRTKE